MRPEVLVKAIKWALYVVVAAVPVVFYTYMVYPANLPKLFVFQVGIEFIAACYAVLLVLDFKRFKPRLSPVLWALLAFIASVSISAIFGVDPLRSFWSIMDRAIGVFTLLHFVALALIISAVGRELNLRRVFGISVLSSAIVALVAVTQHFGIKLITSSDLFAPADRPGTLFGNSAYASSYLLFNFFIGLWVLADHKKKGQKWFFGVMTALIAAGIFAMQSVGAILGFGAGLLALLIFWIFRSEGKSRRAAIAILGLAIIAGGAMYATRHSNFWDRIPGVSRIANFSFSQSDVQDRTIAWKEAIQGFADRPLLGWGPENFNIAFDRHYDPRILFVSFGSTFWDKPHNMFLEYLATGGVVGLLAYLGLLGALIYVSIKDGRRGEGNRFGPFVVAAIAAYAVETATFFDTIGVYLMLALLIGFASSEWLRAKGRVHVAAEERKVSKGKFWGFFVIFMFAAIPLYMLNVNILLAANKYYWGLNYFSNALPADSMKAWDEALSIPNPYKEYAEKDFASIVQQSLQQGLRLPDPAGERDKAIAAMEHVISLHPLNYFYPLVLGDLYNNLYSSGLCGKECLDKSEAMVAKATALSPNRQQIYYVTARTEILRGDLRGALKAFEDAIALNPPSADPHFYYGLLLLQGGDAVKGKAEIELAKKLGRTPANANEAMNLGILIGDKAGDYRVAAEYLKLAADLADKVNTPAAKQTGLEARLRLGLAYYYAKMYAESRGAFMDLGSRVDLETLTVYSQLKPILIDVGVPVGR